GGEVGAAELYGRSPVGGDCQRSFVAVDPLDGSAGAVLDAESVGVPEADDAVAGGELAVGDGEAGRAEGASGHPGGAGGRGGVGIGIDEGAGELVEVGDVAAAKGEHDVARQVVTGVLPPVGE